MFLLDTTTVSDYLRGNKLVVDRMNQSSPRELYLSPITKYEIEYGLRKKPTLRSSIGEQLDELYDKVAEIPLDRTIALTAAAIKYQLVCEGKIISVPDILIAATALDNNLTVVTSNTKDFSRIDLLILIDWKKFD